MYHTASTSGISSFWRAGGRSSEILPFTMTGGGYPPPGECNGSLWSSASSPARTQCGSYRTGTAVGLTSRPLLTPLAQLLPVYLETCWVPRLLSWQSFPDFPQQKEGQRRAPGNGRTPSGAVARGTCSLGMWASEDASAREAARFVTAPLLAQRDDQCN